MSYNQVNDITLPELAESQTIYPVNEVFATIQGEATFTGTPSIFIRLQGCEVGCSWCDTKHTWQLDQQQQINFVTLVNKIHDQQSFANTSITELIEYIQKHYPLIQHVVITGGEPALYNLTSLCRTLEHLGKDIQIETSGTSELMVSPRTWVTLSPKIDMPGGKEVLESVVRRANEIKMPVGKVSDIDKLKHFLHHFNVANIPVWLQPLSQNKSATELCTREALKNNWKLSLQTHKLINIR